MKTLKGNQRKKIIVAILIVLVIGMALVGIFSNNALMASGETLDFENGGNLHVCVYTFTDNGDGTHSGVCQNENCDKTVGPDEHFYVEGRCRYCTATEIPNSGEEGNGSGSGSGHDCVYTFTDNGDGTHSGVCQNENCDKTVGPDEHVYIQGKCMYCAAEEEPSNSGEETCEHDYDLEKNKTHHWEECSKCYDKKALEEHKYEVYTDNKNGTHSSTCTVCGYKMTETHETDGTCTDCKKR